MDQQERAEFRLGMTFHRGFIIVCDGIAAAIFAAAGGLAIGKGYFWGYIFLLAAAVWLLAQDLNIFSSAKLYVRISPDELALFPGGLSAPRFCRWQDVESIDEAPGKKIVLRPRTDKPVVIELGPLRPDDRQALADLIRRSFERSRPTTA